MSRGGRRPGKGYGGPWYGRFPERRGFEAAAVRLFPGIRTSVVAKVGYVIRLRVDVPEYESRNVRILFPKDFPQSPHVFVDGPSSKHRNWDDSLCMWHPKDDEEHRWVFGDGLHKLIGHTILHLIREAWWREHGEKDWPGPEAPHGPLTSKDSPDERADAS